MTTPLIVHQLVRRGTLGNVPEDPAPKSKRARQPVLPEDARRAIALIRERPELAERFLFLCEVEDRAPAQINTACAAAQRLGPLLAGHAVEHLGVLFLDRRHRVIAAEVVSKGGIAATVIDPQVILRRALILRAAALILGHNHPSGDLTPSSDDIYVTRRVKAAASAVGIAIHDHLVIAGAQFTSLAQSGQMP